MMEDDDYHGSTIFLRWEKLYKEPKEVTEFIGGQ